MSQLTPTARKKKNIDHPERRTLFFAPAAGIDVTVNIGKRGFAAVFTHRVYRLFPSGVPNACPERMRSPPIARITCYRLASQVNAAGPHRA
jgi:hypothetical protein